MIRITGGEFRGRGIETPPNDKTRPTQARLRQALYNSIQFHVADAKVLDLFAGSGGLGFEALSRGASDVTFVESARSVAKLIEKNAATLGVRPRTRVLNEDVGEAMPRLARSGPFQIVLADPPYAGGWEMRLLQEFPWESALAPGGLFVIEWGLLKSQVEELPDEVPFLVKTREKTYGDSVLTTFERTP